MTAGMLDGRAALIAGGGRGLGAALCEVFAAHGARVAVIDIDHERAEQVAARIRKAGGVALPIRADLTDPDDVQKLIDTARGEFGTIDALVNNAGGSFALVGRKPTTDYSEAEWDQIVNINLRYVFLMSRAVAPVMIEGGGGAIVNIGSILGINGSPLMAAYGAAKAGLINLTKSLAAELGPSGIRANSISLGHVEVPAGTGAPDHGAAGRLPLRRFGEPTEVAQAAAFLAGDLASYVTGVDITLDGGASTLNVFTLSLTSG